VKSKQKNTQERGKDREYDVTQAAHISTQWYVVTARLSLPVQIQHHNACSSVGKRNTFWVGDSVGETCLPCLTLVSELQQAHCSTAFLSSTKRWHTTVQRRTSRCTTGLIQNARTHRWAHSAKGTNVSKGVY